MDKKYILNMQPGKKHYIAIFSNFAGGNLTIESSHIAAESYEKAEEFAKKCFFFSSMTKFEGLIEIGVIASENVVKADFGIRKEKGEPGPAGVYMPCSYCALRSEIEEQKDSKPNAKCCPFSFENGKMSSCKKEDCMAYSHIIDGSGEFVGEYCKLIDRKEK